MRIYTLICIIGAFIFSTTGTLRAKQPSGSSIQANIIYHFTKYIDWPDSKKTGDFIVGIIDDTPLYNELKSFVANKRVGSQQIVVKKMSASADGFNCHILFISDDEKSNIKKIVTKTAGRSILLVSESEGLASKGSCINFRVIDDRMKLEINKNNIQERNLSIANELLKLAILVK